MQRKSRSYVTVKCMDGLTHVVTRKGDKIVDIYTGNEVEVSPSKLKYLA